MKLFANNNKINPLNEQICGICLFNYKNLTNYPCSSCTQNSWLICQNCLANCNKHSNLCPVCRTKVIEIVVESEPRNYQVRVPTQPILKINWISVTLMSTFIGGIFPFLICMGNGNKSGICLGGGLLCGLSFTILIFLFVKTTQQVNELIRGVIGIIGATIISLTISIAYNVVNIFALLWFCIFCPTCVYFSQKTMI